MIEYIASRISCGRCNVAWIDLGLTHALAALVGKQLPFLAQPDGDLGLQVGSAVERNARDSDGSEWRIEIGPYGPAKRYFGINATCRQCVRDLLDAVRAEREREESSG